jgi:Protein kinase domain
MGQTQGKNTGKNVATPGQHTEMAAIPPGGGGEGKSGTPSKPDALSAEHRAQVAAGVRAPSPVPGQSAKITPAVAFSPGTAGGGGPDQQAPERISWVIDDPTERARRLQDFYDVPDKEMGKGHYGTVRKGMRKTDGVRVAVKTVPKKRAIYVEMLRNEIEILKGLDHTNVIRLYDAFEDEKQVHLIFELCTGGELFDPIADPNFRFTERQASRIVRKLLDTVKHIHAESIVHRDLKPENMLLSQPGIDAELKVIDFGLASHIEPGEVLNKHVGTPYYIAPEG